MVAVEDILGVEVDILALMGLPLLADPLEGQSAFAAGQAP